MQTAVFAILGLVAMIAGLLISVILPELRYIAWGLIGFGIILVTSALIIDFRRVRGAITSRRGKFGASTTIMVSVFVGIVVFVNAISVSVNHRFDFTAFSQFTLTKQTQDVLAKIDMPVKVLCFFTPEDDSYMTGAYATSMLMQYINYTNKIQIKVIDPDQHPEQAREYNITNSSLYQSVVFETDLGKYLVSPEQIIYQAEHSFTNAILEVTGIEQKKVYFLTGHGEASISDTMIAVVDALKTNLLKVYTLDLQTTPAIPEDCATLVVAGPTKPMLDSERQIIADYLNNNGNVLFMTNPGAPDDIVKLLTPWGIDVKSGTIIDPSSYSTPNMTSPSVPRSRDQFGLTTVYFPGATAIKTTENQPDTEEILPIVWTTSNSWLDNNFDPLVTPVYDEGIDEKGSFAIGVLIYPSAVTDSEGNITSYNNGPYIAVFGDSDFATDNHFYNGNNSDLFLTVVNILTSGTDVMSIDRKMLQNRALLLTLEEKSFLNISSIGLLPLIVLAIGAVVWWRRR